MLIRWRWVNRVLTSWQMSGQAGESSGHGGGGGGSSSGRGSAAAAPGGSIEVAVSGVVGGVGVA